MMKDFEEYLETASWSNTNGLYKVVNDMCNIDWFNEEKFDAAPNHNAKVEILNDDYNNFLQISNYDESEVEFALSLKDKIIKEFIKKYEKI